MVGISCQGCMRDLEIEEHSSKRIVKCHVKEESLVKTDIKDEISEEAESPHTVIDTVFEQV